MTTLVHILACIASVVVVINVLVVLRALFVLSPIAVVAATNHYCSIETLYTDISPSILSNANDDVQLLAAA